MAQQKAQEEGSARLAGRAQLVQVRSLEFLPAVLASQSFTRLPARHTAPVYDACARLRGLGNNILVLALERGIGYLEHVENAPLYIGRDMRQSGRTADPADLALPAHLLQRAHQIALLSLLDARVVQLHDVHIVGLQALQALVQPAKQIFTSPDMRRLVGVLVLTHDLTAAL